ncbi:MAG: hypothetical protein FRX49_00658 [Trebouxia sp. A1-2]|nr:MAG: hypothetical protein FRX49_00658 [Trebouxia sp. A1-2]
MLACSHVVRLVSASSPKGHSHINRSIHGMPFCRHTATPAFRPRPAVRLFRQRVEATVALQGTPGLLVGLGAFLAGAALAAFLVAAIPVLLSVRRAAQAMEVMLHTVEREIPETAAAMRLSSMEMSDAIEEVTLLSGDISQGVRSSAAAVTAAEQGVRQGAQYFNVAVKDAIIPSMRSRVQPAKEALETQLKHNTQLQHTEPTLKELARSTKSIAGQVRFGLGLFNALGKAAIANKILQQRPAN